MPCDGQTAARRLRSNDAAFSGLAEATAGQATATTCWARGLGGQEQPPATALMCVDHRRCRMPASPGRWRRRSRRHSQCAVLAAEMPPSAATLNPTPRSLHAWQRAKPAQRLPAISRTIEEPNPKAHDCPLGSGPLLSGDPPDAFLIVRRSSSRHPIKQRDCAGRRRSAAIVCTHLWASDCLGLWQSESDNATEGVIWKARDLWSAPVEWSNARSEV